MNRREMIASVAFTGISLKKEEEVKPQFYYYDIYRNGLTLVSNRRFWCIFVYKDTEDTSKIEGQFPLIYYSEKERDEFVNSKSGKQDISEWKSNGFIVIFREIDVLDIR